jgi:hypothetical protein
MVFWTQVRGRLGLSLLGAVSAGGCLCWGVWLWQTAGFVAELSAADGVGKLAASCQCLTDAKPVVAGRPVEYFHLFMKAAQ